MSARQAKRYLPTNHPAWRRLRELVLAEEPWCRHCLAEKAMPPEPSTEVDHIDGDASTAHSFRRSNLQGLCHSHHSVKTAIENGSFGRKPGTARRKGCDANGTPLDRSHPWRTGAT